MGTRAMSFFSRREAVPSLGLLGMAAVPSPCQATVMPSVPQGVVSSLGSTRELPLTSMLSVRGRKASSSSES